MRPPEAPTLGQELGTLVIDKGFGLGFVDFLYFRVGRLDRGRKL
jgi:hypothetical protein